MHHLQLKIFVVGNVLLRQSIDLGLRFWTAICSKAALSTNLNISPSCHLSGRPAQN